MEVIDGVAARPLAGLALCAGAGTLELGVRLALGAEYRAVGYVERDVFAAAVLVARMADEILDPAPVWDDLTTFRSRQWRGRVDLVTAGFPCQPWSSSGKQQGLDDDRWIWPDVARVVRDVRPRIVFLENVPELALRGGIGVVLGDLADLGFDAEWEMLTASEVGATHRRKRLFVLAHRDGFGRDLLRRLELSLDRQEPLRDHADRQGRAALAYAHGSRRDHGSRAPLNEGGTLELTHLGGSLADTDSTRSQGSVHRTSERGEGSTRSGLFPPGPDERDAWAEVVDRRPCLEPSLRRVADGLAHRHDRLRTIGNGVVPLVAATALVRLAQRAATP